MPNVTNSGPVTINSNGLWHIIRLTIALIWAPILPVTVMIWITMAGLPAAEFR